MEIRFEYSAFAQPFEAQANSQGCTFGDKAEFVQKVWFGLLAARMHGCITDSEYDRILRKFQNKILVPHLKPMEESEVE